MARSRSTPNIRWFSALQTEPGLYWFCDNRDRHDPAHKIVLLRVTRKSQNLLEYYDLTNGVFCRDPGGLWARVVPPIPPARRRKVDAEET